MEVRICKTGSAGDAYRVVELTRSIQGKSSDEQLDPVDGVAVGQVRCAIGIPAILTTQRLGDCLAVVVVNIERGYPFAALAHCRCYDDSYALIKHVARKASQVIDPPYISLQVWVFGAYSPCLPGNTQDKEHFVKQLKAAIREDKTFSQSLCVEHLGKRKPLDPNSFSVFLTCRHNVYDIVVPDYASIQEHPIAADIFSRSVQRCPHMPNDTVVRSVADAKSIQC